MRAVILFGVLLGLPLSFMACSGKAINENDPGELYKEAEEEIESDHYQLALDKLRIVKNKFPYSKYAVDAQLRIADVYFMQESFGEAALAYETFRDLHPKHEKAAYAMFRVGKSHYNDIPSTIARDLTPAQKSLDAYTEFLKRYPTASEGEEAKKGISETRSLLAQKEMYIANFYVRWDQPDSARRRYEKILEVYPDTPSAAEATERLSRVKKELEDKK